MNKNARKWLAALRSGKFLQGAGRLAQRTNNKKVKYCCLGVACTLYEKATKTKLRHWNGMEIGFLGEYTSLPEKIRQWLGLKDVAGVPRTQHGNSCVTMNDCLGMSFEQIADKLEENQSNYFN